MTAVDRALYVLAEKKAHPEKSVVDLIVGQIEQAVAKERGACRTLVKALADKYSYATGTEEQQPPEVLVLLEAEEAIRARGT
jgi:hypothetical protein